MERKINNMLQTSKSVSLRGDSVVEGIKVMSFNAEISEEQLGNSITRSTILNQELYAKNRTECRKDQAEFQNEVYALEDEMILEQVANTEEGATK